jgi:hypothetical protein
LCNIKDINSHWNEEVNIESKIFNGEWLSDDLNIVNAPTFYYQLEE